MPVGTNMAKVGLTFFECPTRRTAMVNPYPMVDIDVSLAVPCQ
jgi:hypothetical protein